MRARSTSGTPRNVRRHTLAPCYNKLLATQIHSISASNYTCCCRNKSLFWRPGNLLFRSLGNIVEKNSGVACRWHRACHHRRPGPAHGRCPIRRLQSRSPAAGVFFGAAQDPLRYAQRHQQNNPSESLRTRLPRRPFLLILDWKHLTSRPDLILWKYFYMNFAKCR